MNEAARLQMLAAIGIAPLVPRFVLDGARPSPQCEVDVPDVAAESAPAIPSIVPVQTSTLSAPAAVEKAARPPSQHVDMDSWAEPVQQPRPRSPSAKVGAGAEALRLQVSLVQHHARCFSLLPVYRAEFQPEADQFLRAVMLSLGIASAPLATHVFRWPFANNAKVDLGPSALREALGSFIQHVAREQDSVVLLWGLDLARHLRDDVGEQTGEFALSPTLRAIATHRVQDYFNEPLRKRELWQQLVALKPVLKTGAA
jgi:hypothetical protein